MSNFQLTYDALDVRDGLQVSRSPWGENDVLGRLNWMTDSTRAAALAEADGSSVFDLGVTYEVGMPCWVEAGDPKFDIYMTHTPRGTAIDRLSGADPGVHDRYPYAGAAISMYSHAGTHLCSLTHFGHNGMFWNGVNEFDHLASRSWTLGGVTPPIAVRAVLLDVAAARGVEELAASHEITVEDLTLTIDAQQTTPRSGDIVLIRTGRMRQWPDPAAFLPSPPGLGMAAARYLCEEVGAMCVGVDCGGEVLPPSEPGTFLPVHCYMFATAGTPMFENLYLEELSAAGVHDLVFTAAPLKIAGTTGMPVRPIAYPRRTGS
ncbi:cyclase family protein [Nocardioides cavernae]|uniref:Cyclase family protein n=1 Tax=Nocardioides cavernae TaxID=1921566 RepID=A0ABR8N7W7_9ACTN|nr:cyclase family protein [Nocardioides cavernae]MBD3924242.1 cyclase family protein [Nocardioides cavernae]MBM7510819.1 kynurenine formamidase [Nocardioides cavernae]